LNFKKRNKTGFIKVYQSLSKIIKDYQRLSKMPRSICACCGFIYVDRSHSETECYLSILVSCRQDVSHYTLPRTPPLAPRPAACRRRPSYVQTVSSWPRTDRAARGPLPPGQNIFSKTDTPIPMHQDSKSDANDTSKEVML
jgi:hypothetical protein